MSEQRVILAVDDEPVVRRVVAQALGKEFCVIPVASGQEALAYLESEKVDLVLTDIMMPGMGGFDLADQVLQSFPTIPIAFLSAFLDDPLRAEAEQRTRHVLAKPMELAELARSVREILQENGVSVLTESESPPQPPPSAPSSPQPQQRGGEMKRNLAAAAIVWQLKKTVDTGKAVRVRVQDETMRPVLEPGDYIEVGRMSPNELRSGDLLFLHQGDMLRVRRFSGLTRVGDKPHVLVRAEGSRETDSPVPVAHVIGRIQAAERDGKRLRIRGLSGGGSGASLGTRFSAWLQDARNWLTLHATE